jgi:hypothetical protein
MHLNLTITETTLPEENDLPLVIQDLTSLGGYSFSKIAECCQVPTGVIQTVAEGGSLAVPVTVTEGLGRLYDKALYRAANDE